MPTLVLDSGEKMIVAGALRRELAALGLPPLRACARVSGADRKPALLVLAGAELVLVGTPETARWPLAEIERVEDDALVTRGGAPVPVTGWWYAPEAQRFRAALRDRIGQPPAPGSDDLLPAPMEDLPGGFLAGFVGAALTLLTVLWSVVAVCNATSADFLTGSLYLAIPATCLLAVPLAICGAKLASRSAQWAWLGILGFLAGVAGSILFILILYVLHALSNCQGECF